MESSTRIVVVRKKNHHGLLLVLLFCLLVGPSLSSSNSGAVVAAQEDTVETPTTCGLWLGPSPIKEANDHGWGHSIFTGRLIKKGQLVLGSGIMDDYRNNENDPDDNHEEEERPFNPHNKDHQEHRDRSEKIFGDLYIPVYDWQALDMGQGPDLGFINYFSDQNFSPGDADDDNVMKRKEKDRLNKENARLNQENRARQTLEFIDDDPPLYQQLWNGDSYHEQLLESYDSLRVFVPGLSNISPCTQRHFNLEQIQQVTYRDWRDITLEDKQQGLQHDTSPPSHQAGSFSYLSNAMFVAARDIQVGEELVVECVDNSDRFDPQDYPPVDFKPKEAGGYSICLDDKIEERLADHTPNVCSTTSRNVYGEKTKVGQEDNNLGGGQRGLFAKKTLEQETILTSTPMIPLHRQELLMNRTTNSNADDTDTVQRQQLLLNYCYGHPESSLLWLPTASLLHAINHAFSSGRENVVQPNAKLMWHHDEYDEDSHLQQNLTRRQRFHHLELLEMPSLQVVKAQGMGLMMDLVATRRIEKEEEIIIDYGEQWNTKWISHQQEWNVELEKITKLHADEKQQHHLEKEKEHRLKKELQELKKKNPNTPIEKLKVEHHHHQKEIVNAMTVKPLGSYVTASDYNELHSSDWLETITEQHHRHREKHQTKNSWSTQSSKVYPSNIQTACYYEMDWLDDDINADVTAESTTYESWYKQEDQLDHSMSCLLPCLIMERRDYVEGEAKRIRNQAEDDDYDDDDHMDDDDDDDDTVSSSSNKKKAYYDSEYKERYTAKLIDNYEENTSIDFDCHLFKRFEYIYEDIPREGIIFVNKPHSTDVWLPKAFREPIGLPLEMVPDIWKDLNPAVSLKAASAAKEKAKQQEQQDNSRKGGMRGSGKKNPASETRKDSTGDGSGTQLELFFPPKKVNPYIHPDVLKYMIIDLKPHEEKQYQNTMKRWTPDTTETRRERLQEMEEKTKLGSILGLQEL